MNEQQNITQYNLFPDDIFLEYDCVPKEELSWEEIAKDLNIRVAKLEKDLKHINENYVL
jgi:hypothetical protein